MKDFIAGFREGRLLFSSPWVCGSRFQTVFIPFTVTYMGNARGRSITAGSLQSHCHQHSTSEGTALCLAGKGPRFHHPNALPGEDIYWDSSSDETLKERGENPTRPGEFIEESSRMRREFTEGIIQMRLEGSKQCNRSCLGIVSRG